MLRKIIKIDEEKCDGCGICVEACHEGAIDLVDGKARLMREDYCDGLGDCLPACPQNAISFEMREAPAYNEAAVLASKQCSCPGSQPKAIHRGPVHKAPSVDHEEIIGELRNWPVQIKLAPINAPYFKDARLLVAADCSAYAYGNFHQKFMRNQITLIGCPKLDDVDYSKKLTAIIQNNDIKSVTVVRMEVPCCGGIEHAVIEALKNSGKMIPWQVVTISTDGEIIE